MLEFERPDYFSVHHLSVPCYLLQHNRYSARAWLEVRALLDKFIHQGWTPQMARSHNYRSAGPGGRGWSLTQGPKLAGVEQDRWQVTVADLPLDSAEAYCREVRRWAEHILIDTQALSQTKN